MEEELSFVMIFSTAWSWGGYVSSTLMVIFKIPCYKPHSLVTMGFAHPSCPSEFSPVGSYAGLYRLCVGQIKIDRKFLGRSGNILCSNLSFLEIFALYVAVLPGGVPCFLV